MQESVTEMMEHMSYANQELARILDAERHAATRLSEVVQSLPDFHPAFGGPSEILESTQSLTQNIVSYLNSLANLQRTIAMQLSYVVRGLKETDDEE